MHPNHPTEMSDFPKKLARVLPKGSPILCVCVLGVSGFFCNVLPLHFPKWHMILQPCLLDLIWFTCQLLLAQQCLDLLHINGAQPEILLGDIQLLGEFPTFAGNWNLEDELPVHLLGWKAIVGSRSLAPRAFHRF